MAASALFTAAALVQVQSSGDKKIQIIGSMQPRASLWIFLIGLLAVAAGSFLYSQGQSVNPAGEFAIFLIAAVLPLLIIRLIHNRKVEQKQPTVRKT
jgi:drug/metabolite transporter (DMT)-like permease